MCVLDGKSGSALFLLRQQPRTFFADAIFQCSGSVTKGDGKVETILSSLFG